MNEPHPAPSPDWAAVYNKKEELVSRSIAGETLVVPVSGRLADLQRIFALEGAGAFIWERLDGERPLGRIRDELLERFAVAREEAERDMGAFIAELTTAGLIVRTGT